MDDLTKITSPFGLLDAETQKALREWPHGWEQYDTDRGWIVIEGGQRVYNGLTYRARPAPLVPDSIDWSHVSPEWKFMARDEDGQVWLFSGEEPYPSAGFGWISDNETQADGFASYRRGTVDWKDSLVERPS